LRERRFQRVEVRMSYRRVDGSVPRRAMARDEGRFDVLATVTPDGEIVYEGL
jgi:hypothetical protein